MDTISPQVRRNLQRQRGLHGREAKGDKRGPAIAPHWSGDPQFASFFGGKVAI
jgi:hypothetical protein